MVKQSYFNMLLVLVVNVNSIPKPKYYLVDMFKTCQVEIAYTKYNSSGWKW